MLLVQLAERANLQLGATSETFLSGAQRAFEGGELSLGDLLEAHAKTRNDQLESLKLMRAAWMASIRLDALCGGWR